MADLVRRPGPQRDRLSAGIFLPAEGPAAELEEALALAEAARPVLDRIRAAGRRGEVGRGEPEGLVAEAVEAGVVGAAEAEMVGRAREARLRVIAVDTFTREEYLGGD